VVETLVALDGEDGSWHGGVANGTRLRDGERRR
jgi:hypothetical protein